MEANAALLIVDLQNDFCPGGALQVTNGDCVIEPANRAARHFAASGQPVLASRDWHPHDSGHFSKYGGIWPVHCVQGTEGAAFHPALCLPPDALLLSKGTDPELPGYSVFEGVTDNGTPFNILLRELGIKKLYICGLATDYCVLHTTLDALRNGYEVNLLTDAVAGVDITPGASADAINEMSKAGAQLMTVNELDFTDIQ